MEINKRDYLWFEGLRFFNVLQKIEGYRLDQRRGAIVVTCSDGDRFYDIFKKQVEVMDCRPAEPRVHVFAWNGGALRIVPGSPCNKSGRTTSADCLDEIRDACAMKKIRTIALYAHAPCGKAYTAKLELIDVAQLLMEAKRILKRELPDVLVAPFMHVHRKDGEDEKSRSYFFSTENFLASRRDIRMVVGEN